jgi:hypothetical protein
MLGPPAPPLPVVVSKLWVPVWAAAVELTGVLAPLNEVQPWAVPSSKSYWATTCACIGLAQSSERQRIAPETVPGRFQEKLQMRLLAE